jgi:hypothetical protein
MTRRDCDWHWSRWGTFFGKDNAGVDRVAAVDIFSSWADSATSVQRVVIRFVRRVSISATNGNRGYVRGAGESCPAAGVTPATRQTVAGVQTGYH